MTLCALFERFYVVTRQPYDPGREAAQRLRINKLSVTLGISYVIKY